MHRLDWIQDRALSLLALLGAAATVLLMLHVGADIVMRNALNAPIPATFEIVTNYYMVALAFIPLAWLERGGGMVQVEVLDSVLSPGLRRLSDILVGALSVAVYAALAFVTLQVALRNAAIGSFLMANSVRVPTWPAYWIPPLGFGLAGLATLIRTLGLILPGPGR